MSTSANRRYQRSQARLQKKINEQFFKRIEGKSGEEIYQIMEQIRQKYGFEKPDLNAQDLNYTEINGTEY